MLHSIYEAFFWTGPEKTNGPEKLTVQRKLGPTEVKIKMKSRVSKEKHASREKTIVLRASNAIRFRGNGKSLVEYKAEVVWAQYKRWSGRSPRGVLGTVHEVVWAHRKITQRRMVQYLGIRGVATPQSLRTGMSALGIRGVAPPPRLSLSENWE